MNCTIKDGNVICEEEPRIQQDTLDEIETRLRTERGAMETRDGLPWERKAIQAGVTRAIEIVREMKEETENGM